MIEEVEKFVRENWDISYDRKTKSILIDGQRATQIDLNTIYIDVRNQNFNIRYGLFYKLLTTL